MNTELYLYPIMVGLGTRREGVLERLNIFEWVKYPGVQQPKAFGNSLKRRLPLLTGDDLVELKFDGPSLTSVRIEGQMFDPKSDFSGRWEELKASLREGFGKHGRPENKGNRPIHQRCIWKVGDADVAVWIKQDWKRAFVVMEITQSAKITPAAGSLDDLFV